MLGALLTTSLSMPCQVDEAPLTSRCRADILQVRRQRLCSCHICCLIGALVQNCNGDSESVAYGDQTIQRVGNLGDYKVRIQLGLRADEQDSKVISVIGLSLAAANQHKHLHQPGLLKLAPGTEQIVSIQCTPTGS